MVQIVHKIEQSARLRNFSDKVFVNFWLYLFIINFFTFGIYGIYVWFKSIIRIDAFIERKADYYSAIATFCERYAIDKGRSDELRGVVIELKMMASNFPQQNKKINVVASAILSVVTLGLWCFVVLYKKSAAWNKLQIFEYNFNQKLSEFLVKTNITKFPITFNIDRSKKRSFALYLFLSIITLGIWALVWQYKMYTDPDDLYKEFAFAEDSVLEALRAAV